MTETTRESLNEALSAAVDGEAEELELRRVLNAVAGDPELRAKWERLHLIGDAMRGGAMRLGDAGVDGLVEPMTGVDAAGAAGARRGRWLAGVAAAAAVMIAVTFVAVHDREARDNQPLVARSSTTIVAEPLSEEDLRLQRDYLIYHAHRSSVANRSPAMNFVRALAVPSGSEEGQ